VSSSHFLHMRYTAYLTLFPISPLDVLNTNIAAKNGWAGANESDAIEVTNDQRLQLQQLQERDADFDRQLEEIGEGLRDLAEVAQLQQEEVQRQSVMLENVGQKLDSAHEHMSNVNARMKETLDEIRKADRICVDIMCIVLMVGLAGVLYKMIKG